MFKHYHVRNYEAGLHFHAGDFKGLLDPGEHWFFDPLFRVRVEVVSQRQPWLLHDKLALIVKSGVLTDRAAVVDLQDHQRALVWVDGRFSHILPPGLYAYWTAFRTVRVEVVDAQPVRFDHTDLAVIVKSQMAD